MNHSLRHAVGLFAMAVWLHASGAVADPPRPVTEAAVGSDTSLRLDASMALGQPDTGGAPAGEPDEPEGLLPIPDYSGDLWSRGALSGDWGGVRDDLTARGLFIKVGWTQVLQSVVDGGRATGTKYGGSLDYLINLDLHRMGLMPGGLVKFRAESRYGESANDLVGILLPANTDGSFPLTSAPDDNIAITVTNLSYTQFLSQQFAVFAGKMDTLDGDLNEFASGRGLSQFLNANFVFNPVGALTVPYSTLGGGIVVIPVDWMTISSAVYNSVDSSTTTGFSDIGDGWTWSTEVQVQYRLGQLPGGQSVGLIYAFDSDFVEIGGGRLVLPPNGRLVIPTKDDTWAVSWNLWQYIHTLEEPGQGPIDLLNGRPDHRGFGVFARAGFADPDTNPLDWHLSAGVGGRGVIPTRDDDTFGVGFFYNAFEASRLFSALGVEDEALGVEAFYNIAVTPAAHLTLDLQVIEPVERSLDTAVLLGLRARLEF